MRSSFIAVRGLAAAGLTTGLLTAQIPVPLEVPLEGVQLLQSSQSKDDPGRPVQMLESPNIDRFLHRAQSFLGSDNHEQAIRILQDVIEGRTLEDPGGEDLEEEGGTEPATTDGGKGETKADEKSPLDLVEDPENAVFSSDGRLYRPVKRLCHELLAELPAEGRALYRAQHEVSAEQALTAAQGVPELEQVFETWFITHAAARAMVSAGDAMMDRGRFRAAIQTFRLLTDVYPVDDREATGVDLMWVRFKTALCFQMLGDRERAAQELAILSRENPDATIRLMGELVRVDQLADSAYFTAARRSTELRSTDAVQALGDAGVGQIVPLWEHRFVDAAPYRAAKASSDRTRVSFGTSSGSPMRATPKHAEFAPGTTTTFIDGRIAFLDHFRLTIAEDLTGRLVALGDGPNRGAEPKAGVPRSRLPAYDWSGQQVAADATRYYCLIGPGAKRLTGMKPVMSNDIEAFERKSGKRVWFTDDNSALRGVTFLAAPQVFSGRLLVPTSFKETFGLHCLDAATGDVLYHVPVHRSGTDYARPPAARVQLQGGLAYVLTNAGGLACIDAYTGSLRWTRRYERSDPYRPLNAGGSSNKRPSVFGGSYFQESSVWGFAPSEVIVHGGLVIFAPCDGRALICLDGATGQPVWMCERGEMRYLLGTDGQNIYAGGPDKLFCIGLEGGVRYWAEELPSFHNSQWRGRGTIANGLVIVPGNRALHVRAATRESASWETVQLPSFSYGRESLAGPFNVSAEGPFIAATYAGGVEVYSTVAALGKLAEDATADPMLRARFQAQAGDLTGAIATLESVETSDEQLRAAVARRMLALCSELALARAANGEREAAVELLARCRKRLQDHKLVQRWHLARIEVFTTLGDLPAVSTEQEALYELMDKKG